MKTLKYRVERTEDNIRYITVFNNNKIFCEIECLGGFLTNEEEIQNWLDDNGYEDEVFNFDILS